MVYLWTEEKSYVLLRAIIMFRYLWTISTLSIAPFQSDFELVAVTEQGQIRSFAQQEDKASTKQIFAPKCLRIKLFSHLDIHKYVIHCPVTVSAKLSCLSL